MPRLLGWDRPRQCESVGRRGSAPTAQTPEHLSRFQGRRRLWVLNIPAALPVPASPEARCPRHPGSIRHGHMVMVTLLRMTAGHSRPFWTLVTQAVAGGLLTTHWCFHFKRARVDHSQPARLEGNPGPGAGVGSTEGPLRQALRPAASLSWGAWTPCSQRLPGSVRKGVGGRVLFCRGQGPQQAGLGRNEEAWESEEGRGSGAESRPGQQERPGHSTPQGRAQARRDHLHAWRPPSPLGLQAPAAAGPGVPPVSQWGSWKVLEWASLWRSLCPPLLRPPSSPPVCNVLQLLACGFLCPLRDMGWTQGEVAQPCFSPRGSPELYLVGRLQEPAEPRTCGLSPQTHVVQSGRGQVLH